jgi:hypothetical protein
MDQKPGNELSPEKKLLEIIEKTKDEPVALTGSKTSSVKALDKKKSSIFGLKAGFLSAGTKIKTGFVCGSSSLFEIEKINRILFGSVIIVSLYMVIFFIIQSHSVNKNVKFSFDDINKMMSNQPPVSLSSLQGAQQEYLAVFLEKAARRNIFKPANEIRKSIGSENVQNKGLDLARNLKLVGTSIGTGAKDSYAMVEDAATKTTYFLRKDESIFGAKVSEVDAEGVVLSYDGSSIEIR